MIVCVIPPRRQDRQADLLEYASAAIHNTTNGSQFFILHLSSFILPLVVECQHIGNGGTKPVAIRFGTDGWRAVISEDFTFGNVRRVAQAIADYIVETDQSGPVVVGFDTRFLSDRYAIEVANVLAGNDLPVYLSKADCPTPALSYAVKDLQASGVLSYCHGGSA